MGAFDNTAKVPTHHMSCPGCPSQSIPAPMSTPCSGSVSKCAGCPSRTQCSSFMAPTQQQGSKVVVNLQSDFAPFSAQPGTKVGCGKPNCCQLR
ncbi:hypothetical protein GEMRC1_002444 [Eukaryota sp. GEM-RC1]